LQSTELWGMSMWINHGWWIFFWVVSDCGIAYDSLSFIEDQYDWLWKTDLHDQSERESNLWLHMYSLIRAFRLNSQLSHRWPSIDIYRLPAPSFHCVRECECAMSHISRVWVCVLVWQCGGSEFQPLVLSI
jgi:hypothetical protein